jgi:hypothetical protein
MVKTITRWSLAILEKARYEITARREKTGRTLLNGYSPQIPPVGCSDAEQKFKDDIGGLYGRLPRGVVPSALVILARTEIVNFRCFRPHLAKCRVRRVQLHPPASLAITNPPASAQPHVPSNCLHNRVSSASLFMGPADPLILSIHRA